MLASHRRGQHLAWGPKMVRQLPQLPWMFWQNFYLDVVKLNDMLVLNFWPFLVNLWKRLAFSSQQETFERKPDKPISCWAILRRAKTITKCFLWQKKVNLFFYIKIWIIKKASKRKMGFIWIFAKELFYRTKLVIKLWYT